MKDHYMERWERLRTLDSLSEDERQTEIFKNYALVRQTIASLPNTSPRRLIKALRLTFDVLDRNGPRIRWLRKGVYRLGVGELSGSRERPLGDPYEVYRNGKGWEWRILIRRQADDDQLFARWYCAVKSPESDCWNYGDVYVREIKKIAYKGGGEKR